MPKRYGSKSERHDAVVRKILRKLPEATAEVSVKIDGKTCRADVVIRNCIIEVKTCIVNMPQLQRALKQVERYRMGLNLDNAVVYCEKPGLSHERLFSNLEDLSAFVKDNTSVVEIERMPDLSEMMSNLTTVIQKAIARTGNLSAFARKLKVSRQTAHAWVTGQNEPGARSWMDILKIVYPLDSLI